MRRLCGKCPRPACGGRGRRSPERYGHVRAGSCAPGRVRGKGVATEFIGRVLDELRHNGRLVTVYCPLVRSFIDSHPQYADMVDREHPGLPSHAEG
ncbi:N-acetyltransferase [Leifsonia sp. NPDC056824]|uniref:N-acetyltransferase n=1 Tax=Leifsonia sp. NPDC056824 TaxID=3345953 RepID=UPI0036C2F562